MVRISEIYGKTEYLSTEVVERLGLWLTSLRIEKAEVRELKGVQKIVLTLKHGTDYYDLPLNRTNALILAQEFGDDTENWVGKDIILQKVKRNFQGKLVDAIEVKAATEKKIVVKKKTEAQEVEKR